MIKYIIKTKGSSNQCHEISLYANEKNIMVTCTCQAGKRGQLCHHKTDLLNGDMSILYDTADIETLNKITALIKKTNYQKLMQEYTQIKQDIEKLRKYEKNFRKKLERTLQSGLEVI